MIRLIIGAGLGLMGGIAAVAMKRANKKADEDGREWVSYDWGAVSYTHLTLPTT